MLCSVGRYVSSAGSLGENKFVIFLDNGDSGFFYNMSSKMFPSVIPTGLMLFFPSLF